MERDVDAIQSESEKYIKIKDPTCFKLLKEYITAYSLNPQDFVTYIRKPAVCDNF